MAKDKPAEAAALPPANKRWKTLSLDLNEVFKLHTALTGLDGYDRAVGDKVVKEFYSLGALRLDIARNLSALERISEDFEKARSALVKECEPESGKGVKEGDKKWPRFKTEFERMSSQKQEIKLAVIDLSKLDIAKNPIPVLVLAALEPILVGKVEDEGEDQDD
jgi:hypothetical protein